MSRISDASSPAELLPSQSSAVHFFNAQIERYPDHVGHTILWAGASAIYADAVVLAPLGPAIEMDGTVLAAPSRARRSTYG